MHIARYIGLTLEAEQAWIDALALVARRHPDEPDIRDGLRLLSRWAQDHLLTLGSITNRLGLLRSLSPSGLQKALFRGGRGDSLGLLRDLQDLFLMATQTRSCWTVLLHAARALKDIELEWAAEYCGGETVRALAWLDTRIHQTTPQAVTVPAASREQDPPSLAALTRVSSNPLRRARIPWAIMLAIRDAAVVGLRVRGHRTNPLVALQAVAAVLALDSGRGEGRHQRDPHAFQQPTPVSGDLTLK